MTASPNRCPYCGSPTTTAGHHIPAPPAFPLTAEQLVRGAGFILGLWHIRTKLPGEQIPSAEQLTLNLAAAVGVPLPTHQHQVAILPNGKKVQTTLAPPRAIPTSGTPEGA